MNVIPVQGVGVPAAMSTEPSRGFARIVAGRKKRKKLGPSMLFTVIAMYKTILPEYDERR